MELLDQAVEQLFLRRAPDLAQFNGCEVFDLTGDRLLADLYVDLGPLAAERVIVACFPGRQGDKLLPFKDEQEPPAYHIFQLAISLSPIPGLADAA